MAIAEAIIIIQGITAAAELITALDNMFNKDEQGQSRELNPELARVLAEVTSLKKFIGSATREVLEEVREVQDQIDEDVALDNVTLANSAIQWLQVSNNKDQALDASFRAADRLYPETSVLFTTAFSYVVDIRTLVIKDKDRCYWANEPFKSEVLRYLNKLDLWISRLNTDIQNAHTVSVSARSHGGKPPERYWEARYLRNGVVAGRWESDGFHEAARQAVTREANAARARGIASDRQRLGVLSMEKTAATLRKPFTSQQRRQSVAAQLLNGRQLASDLDPDVIVMDGQVVPSLDDDVRSDILNVVCTPAFRQRVQRSFRAFRDGDDDRIVNLAYHRLFQRNATEDEASLLRGVAATYGFEAFVAALLYSHEYEQRYGRGAPAYGGGSLAADLETEAPILLSR